MAMFKTFAGPLQGKRVLELGPLEGGHTLQLARAGASVVGIEGHEANYERCLYIKELFGLTNAEFILGDLRTFDFESLGQFDAVFNVGVLYHLDEPWKLLTSLGRVSNQMFVATHCGSPDNINAVVDADGYQLRGTWWIEGPLEASLSGLQEKSFWPTRQHLEKMLIRTGWTRLKWLQYDPDFKNGPLACLSAERLPQGLTGRLRQAVSRLRR
jgi:SAM-dependent methyltransferase